MNSIIKFSFYTFSAILFIGGLNSIVNGEENSELLLWLIPFLCIGSGIAIPLLIVLFDTYANPEILDSNVDNNIDSNVNSDNDKTDHND